VTRRNLMNIAASVHQRLLNKAKVSDRPFNELLQYFAIERFMYRLSKSPHAGKFTLKGALMLAVWATPTPRPTKDMDLLGRIDNSIDAIAAAMREVCNQKVESDGMAFDAGSVEAGTVVEDAVYEGIRVRVSGSLGNARVSVSIDIGFGDVVMPPAKEIDYPTILEFPAPKLKGYSRESTVAEKFEAMVKLESLNSRMKDFYDIWFLAQRFDFEGKALSGALQETFRNRKTEMIVSPVVLEVAFAKDPTKGALWRAFVRKSRLTDAPGTFEEVHTAITAFLEPIVAELAEGRPFQRTWKAPGPWT
jgi:hypothetical protein